MKRSNYDKSPSTVVSGNLWKGWEEIIGELKKSATSKDQKHILTVECYHGVHHDELLSNLSALGATIIDTAGLFKTPAEIEAMTQRFVTDDILFGYQSSFSYQDFLDEEKTAKYRQQIKDTDGLIIIYGHGASVVYPQPDTLIYADMARWEIIQRFRRKEVNGLGVVNKDNEPSRLYKRGYFVDWKVCDDLKKELLPCVDYWLDTHQSGNPKMITGTTMLEGLEMTAHRPFRVVPFFDPAPWGGQWMKDVCSLDPEKPNYGWCFDCVPEENSLYFKVKDELFEMPSNNLVFQQTRALLGGPVEARFGQYFPIRFDFLDTVGGGNLSLQVHPTTQYIRDAFGMPCTQDESYYIIDAEDDASVYLGLKTGVDKNEMINALNESQQTGKPFDAEKYANKWQAKKHDHFLIPGGTVHCSGSGALVLEISSTPNLFTFKLWDWGRLGLDGKPRPINIKHGSKVIQWERQTDFTQKHLINAVEVVAQDEDWVEEKTGLHENEFIETRRHWFTGTVPHNTDGGVNVLNVTEGEELIIESPSRKFDPFIVHYAETFIIPASVGEYTIRPYGASEGKKCSTIKAYIRFRN